MTPEQQSFFRENGYLFLKGALAKSHVRPLREYVLEELKKLGIRSSGKGMPPSLKKLPPFQQITKLSQMIKVPDLQSRIVTPDLLSTINSLAGIKTAPAQGRLLVSPPGQGRWTLNGLNWHTDISSSDADRMPGIQAFILIDDVKVHGGATLAVAGSHRPAGNVESGRRVREILRSNGEMENELRSRNLSIIEMSGNAGDVYLMDMRVLHTPSVNSTNHVRIMATVRYFSSHRK